MRAHDLGGAGTAGAPRRDPPCGERGSQAVEFALVLPLAFLLLALILAGGLLGVDYVMAQGLAREAARVAAVADDAQVSAAVTAAATGRQVAVEVDPPAARRRPGGQVRASVRVQSRAFAWVGVRVWLPAQAVMLVEDA